MMLDRSMMMKVHNLYSCIQNDPVQHHRYCYLTSSWRNSFMPNPFLGRHQAYTSSKDFGEQLCSDGKHYLLFFIGILQLC